MKAFLLTDHEYVNPLYLAEPDKKKRAEIKPFLVVPAGTEIDDPDCWRLCTIGAASPADEECAAKTLAVMGSAKRQKFIADVKALMAAEGNQKLDKTTQKWLDQMKKSYATELGLA